MCSRPRKSESAIDLQRKLMLSVEYPKCQSLNSIFMVLWLVLNAEQKYMHLSVRDDIIDILIIIVISAENIE